MLSFASFSLNTRKLPDSSNKTLIKVRLGLYTAAFIHLVSVATLLLTIDFSQYDDPDIRMYEKIRFKLITAWFNLLTIAYFPICLYCDWRELRGQQRRSDVILLNRIRHICFTSILLPVTAFGDILFWRVWNTRSEMIAPPSIHSVVPFWTQHCMHTVSLVVVLLDLVLVRRERPKNNLPNIALMSVFLFAYITVCIKSYLDGIYVYPGLKQFSGFKLPMLVFYVYVESFFYYTSQWLIVDMVWGQGNVKHIFDSFGKNWRKITI